MPANTLRGTHEVRARLISGTESLVGGRSRNRGTTDVSTTNGAKKEGCGRQNGMKLSLLTSHASVCNTTMVGFKSGNTVERGCLNSCVMHRHTGPAPGIIEWGGIGYHFRTPP
ncbi:transposable element Tcb1 transposase [Trichonephila clavipes]|nr:transposable element Tcb1 transposase [Trichonephila clavipes]